MCLEEDLLAISETEIKIRPLTPGHSPRITGARGVGGGLVLHVLKAAPVADDLIEPALMAVACPLAIILDDAAPDIGGARVLAAILVILGDVHEGRLAPGRLRTLGDAFVDLDPVVLIR